MPPCIVLYSAPVLVLENELGTDSSVIAKIQRELVLTSTVIFL